MGAPTKLDDLRARRILDAIRAGHSLAAAARAGGIDDGTLLGWRHRGAAGEEPYMGFLRRLEDAEHEAEDRAVKVLISKFDSDDDRVAMQAAQWWLARRRKVCWAEQKDAVEPPTEEECRALVEKIRGTGT